MLSSFPFLLFLAGFSDHSGEPSSPPSRFELRDVFELEYASEPRISPDGEQVAFLRNFMDIMSDRRKSQLWITSFHGGEMRPLSDPGQQVTSPRWSPDGTRLLFLSRDAHGTQISMLWLDTRQTATLTRVNESPSDLSWSPDGRWISFVMRVPAQESPLVTLPQKPQGAEWAPPARVIQRLNYRRDGAGFIESGFRHLFVLPVEGGTPRQVTSGEFHHQGPASWTPDGKALLFAANRRADWEHHPRDTEIYQVSLEDGAIRELTDRRGPDESPVVSPDGRFVASLGFEDRFQGYQVTRLSVWDREQGSHRVLTQNLDRSVANPQWSADGKGLFLSYSDQGNTRVAYVSLDGDVEELAIHMGGTSLGRPYSSGSFTVSPTTQRFAYTMTRPSHPADVAVGQRGSEETRRLTRLNDDLFASKPLAHVEEIWCESSFDQQPIQGWIAFPPDFDPQARYPLILEIHGGPFADYGDRFAAEVQCYAAAGYVVLYVNPRGSTSYGEEFGNLIHHRYPGHDYDDLMSAVDAVVDRGFIDPNQLFVTGGSGGGVLTAWIVGKTDRFRAAVVAKPVINWYSFVLTADLSKLFTRYWFPGYPWEHPEHYMARSPISLVGNVTTPTMLLTGAEDHRTPISESEQYYQALKLRRVDSALVRIPGASHGIANRPSHLISKVAHILAWFEKYRDPGSEKAGAR